MRADTAETEVCEIYPQLLTMQQITLFDPESSAVVQYLAHFLFGHLNVLLVILWGYRFLPQSTNITLILAC